MSTEMATELVVMREAVNDCEIKLSDAVTKVDEAEQHVLKLEKELNQWRRYLEYQSRRRSALNAKLRIDREMVRTIEDYNSNTDMM